MRIKKLWLKPRLISLIGLTLALTSCQSVTIQNRQPCFVNGELSLGGTCSNTVTDHNTWQLTPNQVLDMLEARPAMPNPDPSASPSILPAHPPGVFQSAQDYGEETTELEVACRLLGNDCSYALKQTVEAHKNILKQINQFQVR